MTPSPAGGQTDRQTDRQNARARTDYVLQVRHGPNYACIGAPVAVSPTNFNIDRARRKQLTVYGST